MFKWDIDRISAVMHAQAAEGQSLEFKSQLPAASDRGKAEFLKDVSAMANAAGGAILFGVNEKSGAAESLSGLQLADPDAEIRRLSQILESGVEPRLAGVQFCPFKLGDSDVLVVNVPQSFDAPHRFLFNGHSKFVRRVGTHVSELTYDQLRAAFDLSSERISRIREQWAIDFSLSRLWKRLREGPVCVLRLSSLVSADGRQTIDPQDARNRWTDLIQSEWAGGSPAYNYEGLIAAPGHEDSLVGYTQVYRTGAITSYRVVGTEWKGDNLFIPGWAERFLMEALPKSVDFLRNSGIAGSAVIQIGITELSGYKFGYTDHGFSYAASGNLERLELPELLIDDFAQDINYHALLRPGFDLIWQSYGQANCRNYREDGSWKELG